MGDDDKDKKAVKVDERPEFFWNYIMKTMRLKQEKWNKMITNNEYKVSAKGSRRVQIGFTQGKKIKSYG